VTIGLAMHWPYVCHRLCGLSTYRLKAHVREMSTCLSSPLGMASLYLFIASVVSVRRLLHMTSITLYSCVTETGVSGCVINLARVIT